MKKAIGTAVIALVLVLVVPLSFIASALWDLYMPFGSKSFSLNENESYYLNTAMQSKVSFISTSFVGSKAVLELNGFANDKDSTFAHITFDYLNGDPGSWKAGEVLSLDISFTVPNVGNPGYTSGNFSANPDDYKLSVIQGQTAIVFTASSFTYEGAGSTGLRNVTVKWLATQNVESEIAVKGTKWVFDLPMTETNATTYEITFGQLKLGSVDGLENANTQKVVDAIEKSADEIINADLGYEKSDENKEVESGLNEIQANIDRLNKEVDGVRKTIDDGAAVVVKGAQDFGAFINQFFEKLPLPLTGLVVGLLIFLVCRKAVGR